jgi:hypothetical protein
MGQHDFFELHRQSDGLIYQFDRKIYRDGVYGYQRRDQDLWIIYKQKLGWVAYDDETQSLTGRSWDVLPELQGDHPPEGIWVSRKNEKSYVYELKYFNSKI